MRIVEYDLGFAAAIAPTPALRRIDSRARIESLPALSTLRRRALAL
ncbi:hypothetical protein [Pseudomonas sp. CGJS7]